MGKFWKYVWNIALVTQPYKLRIVVVTSCIEVTLYVLILYI